MAISILCSLKALTWFTPCRSAPYAFLTEFIRQCHPYHNHLMLLPGGPASLPNRSSRFDKIITLCDLSAIAVQNYIQSVLSAAPRSGMQARAVQNKSETGHQKLSEIPILVISTLFSPRAMTEPVKCGCCSAPKIVSIISKCSALHI